MDESQAALEKKYGPPGDPRRLQQIAFLRTLIAAGNDQAPKLLSLLTSDMATELETTPNPPLPFNKVPISTPESDRLAQQKGYLLPPE